MHAQKGTTEVPRTHFRECKIFWGRAPRPLPSIYIVGPAFCIGPGPLPSSQWS